MKNNYPFFSGRIAAVTLVIAFAAPLIPSSALATTGSWIYGSPTAWSNTGAWSGGAVNIPGANAGDTAILEYNQTTAITGTLTAGETLGTLDIGTGAGAGTYTIAGGTGPFTLTFNNSASTDAAINVVATSKGDTISAPVAIGGDGALDFNNASTNAFTISGAISQTVTSGTINVQSGALTLSGANGFSGGVTITGGSLVDGNATGAGSGTITIGAAGYSANASAFFGFPTAGTVTNPITVASGYTGTPTIGLGVTGTLSATLNGNITLNENTTFNNQPTALGEANLVVNGLITGTGGINIAAATYGASSSSGQFYGPYGICWDGVILSNTSNSFGGDVNVQAGDLVLSATYYNGTAGSTVYVGSITGTNADPIYLGSATGIQEARIIVSATNANVIANLNRNVTVQPGGAGYAAIYAGSGQSSTYMEQDNTGANTGGNVISGNISLNKSLLADGEGDGLKITGNITAGPGAIGGVGLALDGVFSSGGPQGKGTYGVALTGSNSYNGGTVVWAESSAGAFGLGTGSVVIEGNSSTQYSLDLTATNSLAPNKTILVGAGGEAFFNSSFTAAQIGADIDPASVGGITEIATGGPALNMAVIGSGSMYLTGITNGVGTQTTLVTYLYTAATLGSGTDGIYRLGLGENTNADGVLVLTKSVLIDNSNPGSGSAQVINGGGAVTLGGSNNTYTGGTVVNFELSGSASSVAGQSPFGSGTGSITLNNCNYNGTNTSGLELLGQGTAAAATNVGVVTFNGATTIGVTSIGSNSNTLQAASFARGTYGTVDFELTGAASYVTTTTSGSAPLTAEINGGANQILPAYYYNASGFLTWLSGTGAGTGFASATAGTTLAAGNFSLGTGTDSYVVEPSVSATMTASGTASGLAMTSGTVTLTGYTLSLSNNSGVAGVFTNGGTTTSGTLNFGTNEGVLVNQAAATINSTIWGSNGITVSGWGGLTFKQTNTFTGPLVLNQGALTVTTDNELGASASGSAASLYFNGGTLNISTATGFNANRNVTIGAYGGALNISGNSGSPYAPFSFTIPGVVSGAGSNIFYVSSSAGLAPNLVTLVLSNTNNTFTAPIDLVPGADVNRIDLSINNGMELGNGNLPIMLQGGVATLVYNGAISSTTGRGLNFIEQGGAVDTSVSGTLTMTGPITGAGAFYKNGIGELALTGSGSETGNIAIAAGILNIQNSYSLGASSAVVTGSIGISGGGAFVENGATLELQNSSGNVAVGNKNLYLSGTGAGGLAALYNVSGTNSMAGPVILQSVSSIGAAAGSTLSLSGSLMGNSGLSKVGTGTLVLAGISPSFSGPTTVNGGNLIVSGSLSGTVNVAAGTLNGSGFTGAISGTTGAHVSPGSNNTPAILTAPQVAGQTGLTFDFALTQNAPNYGTPAASGNDLLSLTGATPFSLSLNSANTLNVYLASATGAFAGGFFITGAAQGTNDLLASVSGATFNYYVEDNSAGAYSFDGNKYDLTPGAFIPSETAANGGEELVFTAVPEPGTWGSILAGLALLGLWQRRANRAVRN